MPQQHLNLGSGPDTGTGDTHAAAFDKIQDNFTELYGLGEVITESTIARTLSLTDAGNYIRLTHASGCAITVPPQADVAWLDRTEIVFRVAAAGPPSITEGSGVTVNGKSKAADLVQNDTFALKRVSSNLWDFI